ncbi:hypothetical protein RMSM_01871 [Rhodopirellula maiorica SM1]|uniref:Uncharacterized protein n=1 Tax=Rhodopirellula maiorica SM1 TaxID=1265738 RepID=M5S4S5_9BACT|nr:hypothetical protein RMSM_01871 [Rhodopirellula maiorica SM1]
MPAADEVDITGGIAESKIGLMVGNQPTIERPPKVACFASDKFL